MVYNIQALTCGKVLRDAGTCCYGGINIETSDLVLCILLYITTYTNTIQLATGFWLSYVQIHICRIFSLIINDTDHHEYISQDCCGDSTMR